MAIDGWWVGACLTMNGMVWGSAWHGSKTMQAYAKEIGAMYIETSAKDDVHVQDMFVQLSTYRGVAWRGQQAGGCRVAGWWSSACFRAWLWLWCASL